MPEMKVSTYHIVRGSEPIASFESRWEVAQFLRRRKSIQTLVVRHTVNLDEVIYIIYFLAQDFLSLRNPSGVNIQLPVSSDGSNV